MKLLTVLSVIACSYAAKLDRTYLPPASASSAGGSPDNLNTPFGSIGQLTQSSRPSGLVQPSDGSSFGQPTGSTFGKTSGPASSGQQKGFEKGQQSGSSGLGLSSGVPQYGQTSGPASYAPGPISYGKSESAFDQLGQTFGLSTFGQGNQGIQGANAYDAQRYQPERPRASIDRNAEILRYDNQNDGDSFAYSFETSNGISAEESGVATNGVQAQGGYSYTADDGQVFSVAYTADENGYQPRGDHLPTPPPIPDEILKSIEDNARAAAAGTQEGAYRLDENDSRFAPQQYSKETASTNGQNQGYVGQTGVSALNRPQGKGQSLQQYGVPKTGAVSSADRPVSGFQGFNQPQNQDERPSQQYGTPTSRVAPSAGRASTGSQGFNQPQNQYESQNQVQGPAQQTNAGAATTASRPLTGLQGFNQPQNKYRTQANGSAQEYGTPTSSAPRQPSTSSSRGYNLVKPTQYYPGSGQSVPFTPAGSNRGFPAQNGITRSQSQDDSGYQYNRPQGSSQLGRESTQDRSSQSPGQFHLETRPNQRPGQFTSGAPTQGSFPRPSEISGQGFGIASDPSSQGTFGRTGPSGQFQLTQPSGPKAFMSEQSGYNYNTPGSQTPGDSRPQQLGSQQTGFRPDSFNQEKPGPAFGAPRQPPSFSSEEGYKY